MKKVLLSVLMMVAVFALNAQTLVDTLPHNKKVVLEEYTGINCGYCPDGHKIAKEIKDANPDDVFLINIHTGSFASPGAGQPDFTTSFGTALANQTGLTGYPSGTVNRHIFTGGKTALSRSAWSQAATQIMGEASYANVGVSASIDAQTREMVVDVEIYFTADGASAINLNVALMQDNVEGPQSGGANFNPTQILPNGKYNHMHMLRHLLTGQWGEEITTTTQGTLVTKQYTYTLPADIKNVDLELGNLHVVAFIAEGHQEIITGDEALPSYTGITTQKDVELKKVMLPDESCEGVVGPKIKVVNNGGEEVTELKINYDFNGEIQYYDMWTGSIPTFASVEIQLTPRWFTMLADNTCNVEIVKVNGSDDENSSDNSISEGGLLMYSAQTVGADHVVEIVQDRYGSEITWEILDASGNVVASGGPYADLSASGTQTHTHNVTLTSNGCHTLAVYDAYGDGFYSSQYGQGSYKLSSPYGDVISENATFGNEVLKLFKETDITAVQDERAEVSVDIFPNPTSGLTNLNISLTESSEVSYAIFSATGQQVQRVELGQLVGGNHQKSIDMSNYATGIYMVQLNINGEMTMHRISVK